MSKLKIDQVRLIGYLIVFIIIVAFPIWKIIAFEFPKVAPNEYLFKTEIYDPYDPMRGRYVRLTFDQQEVYMRKNKFPITSYGEDCFAVLGTDKDNNAVITDLYQTREEVPAGKDCLRVKYSGMGNASDDAKEGQQSKECHLVRLPFDRFYMNEKLAPEAEELVSTATRKGGKALLKVKIYRDGSFAVSDLLIDGQPIRELIRNSP